jgi:hypothetical protein
MRGLKLLPIGALFMAACGGLTGGAELDPPPWARDSALLLGSSGGVVSVDPGSGKVLFESSGVPSLGDWSTVFTASFTEGRTLVEARDAATGALRSRLAIQGRLDVRVASVNGGQVALMEPLAEGQTPWTPVPRATTDIVVAEPSGGEQTRFHLRGNFEPEAFSLDGRSLYMIRFVPPTEPAAYRVARLDLASGKVFPVSTGAKGVVETMAGTRLEQLASPDGRMLYTLYTTGPAAYAGPHDHDSKPVAFIHTLNLKDGWAHCIALPEEMWGGDPADEAMALSPDGKRLYLVDTTLDLVARMNTRSLSMKQFSVDFPEAHGPAHAATGEDGTLFAAAGTWLVDIDPTEGTITRTRTLSGPASALGTGPGGLVVALPGRIEVLDPVRERPVGEIPSPPVADLAYVGVAST